ncbi:MAG: anti-sigma factor [Rhodobacteraceae bacterium]|nr:anti-sigma factor [Paracoccaceae bacterium]
MTAPHDLPEEDEALAAEVALGLLTGAEAAEAERRMASEPAFRAAVAAWQERLAPLAGEVPEVAPPPRVARALEARLSPRGPRTTGLFGRLERLRGPVSGALAAAVVLALALLALAPFLGPPRPAPLGATLVAGAGELRFEARYDAAAGRLVVTRAAGPPPAQGQAHELWLIAPDAAPVSLGLIGEAGLAVAYPEPPEGWTLAVSLEPAGGSPTGAPTGPVLAAAPLTRL